MPSSFHAHFIFSRRMMSQSSTPGLHFTSNVGPLSRKPHYRHLSPKNAACLAICVSGIWRFLPRCFYPALRRGEVGVRWPILVCLQHTRYLGILKPLSNFQSSILARVHGNAVEHPILSRGRQKLLAMKPDTGQFQDIGMYQALYNLGMRQLYNNNIKKVLTLNINTKPAINICGSWGSKSL